jgi:predicted alpha/beta-hydrolase family hydrolase
MLVTGPAPPAPHLIIAHGAGAGITNPFLEKTAELLAERGIGVTRFEFSYMSARRDGGARKPPPKAEKLIPEYEAVLAAVSASLKRGTNLAIGGKSMGGRVASMIAENEFKAGRISALVCLGYPFHPPGQPEKLRTEHLKPLSCPSLIVQGERDPFGNRAEVEALQLSKAISLHWIGDGDHDFGPRGASGFTRNGNLIDAADAVANFLKGLKDPR